MKAEVRIAGFGGQGVITAGIILARAAALHDNKFALQTQSYGPEARGGASKCEVIISDKEIYYPKVRGPDMMLVMSPQALEKYKDDLKEDGILVYDSVMIREIPEGFKNYGVPGLTLAKNELGKTIVTNILMLGSLVAVTEVVSKKALEKAVLESVPKGTEELNKKALELGFKEAEKLLK